jgi:hypothetical protein
MMLYLLKWLVRDRKFALESSDQKLDKTQTCLAEFLVCTLKMLAHSL